MAFNLCEPFYEILEFWQSAKQVQDGMNTFRKILIECGGRNVETNRYRTIGSKVVLCVCVFCFAMVNWKTNRNVLDIEYVCARLFEEFDRVIVIVTRNNVLGMIRRCKTNDRTQYLQHLLHILCVSVVCPFQFKLSLIENLQMQERKKQST